VVTFSSLAIPEQLTEFLDQNVLHSWSVGAPQAKVVLLQTYIDEASFFYGVVRNQFDSLSGRRVLEVGSGIGLFSLLMSTHGSAVTSLEPESAGFGSMVEFRELIVKAWLGPRGHCNFLSSKLEELPFSHGFFDVVLAINVIEHVPGYGSLISQMVERTAAGGSVWIVCPNYAFPIEQHLSIPILLNKSFTWSVFGHFLRKKAKMDQVEEFWSDLSWPTHWGVKKKLLKMGHRHHFSRRVFQAYVERLTDERFVARKGLLFSVVRPLRPVLSFLGKWWPLAVLPVIELSIARNNTENNELSHPQR
jgi:SAM-dependent methyltransferase